MIFVNKGFKRDANKSSTPGLEGWRCQYHQQRGWPLWSGQPETTGKRKSEPSKRLSFKLTLRGIKSEGCGDR